MSVALATNKIAITPPVNSAEIAPATIIRAPIALPRMPKILFSRSCFFATLSAFSVSFSSSACLADC